MQVKIISGDGKLPRVEDAETGEVIKGIARAQINIEPNEVTAVLELSMVQTSMILDAKYMLHNPATGKLGEVFSVTFADGTEVRF